MRQEREYQQQTFQFDANYLEAGVGGNGSGTGMSSRSTFTTKAKGSNWSPAEFVCLDMVPSGKIWVRFRLLDSEDDADDSDDIVMMMMFR